MAIKIGDALLTIGIDTSDVDKGLKRLGDKMGKMGKQLSLKVTAPLVGLGLAGFKMAGDFDQAFRKVNVMLKATAEESKAYKKEILALSQETAKSAVDVTDAFFGIVSAGFRGAEAMDILAVAMKGATGGAADTVQTTAALTKAMNIFELKGMKGATRAMDTFFGIVDVGLLTFEEMALSFPMAATMAAALGIEIEEVGAALGTLTKVSGNTRQAATALNATFIQLVKPSEALQDLYEEWGVRTGPEAIDRFGGLQAVLQKVSDETHGNADELAKLFPNVEAIRAILPLTTTSAQDFADALVTVGDRADKSGKAFAEMAQGPGFQWQQMMVSMKNTMIVLGDSIANVLGPILEKVTGAIRKAVEWFSKLPEPIRTGVVVVLALAAVLGPLLIMAGLMVNAYVALTAAQIGLNIAMFANPIGLVVLAIGGLLIGIGLLLNKFGLLDDVLGGVWRGLTQIVKPLTDMANALFGVSGATEEVVEGADELTGAWKQVSDSVNVVAKSIEDSWKRTGAATKEAMTKAIKAINDEYGMLEDEEQAAHRTRRQRARDTAREIQESNRQATADAIRGIEDQIREEERLHKVRLRGIESDAIRELQDKIDLLDDDTREEELALREQARVKHILQLKDNVASAKDAEEARKEQRKLEDAEARYARERLLETREGKKEVLRDEIQAIRDGKDEVIILAQEQADKEFAILKTGLEAQITNLETNLEFQKELHDATLIETLARIEVERLAEIELANEKIRQAQRVARERAVLLALATVPSPSASPPEGFIQTSPGTWHSPAQVAMMGLTPMQHGGIAMRPINARIAERGPEAVIPLSRAGIFGTANIIIELDGMVLAEALGEPLVDEIRIRTGAKN